MRLVFGLCMIVTAMALSSTAVAGDGFGRITGRIVFEGDDPTKLLPSGSLDREKDAGIKWVAVFLQSDSLPKHPTLPLAEESITTIQITNGRLPFVSLARAGGSVRLENTDARPYSYKLSGNISELAIVPGKEAFEFRLWEPEISPALHISPVGNPLVRSWIVAPATPYAAVTDRTGAFVIDPAPAGEHVLHFRHPAIRWPKVMKRGRREVLVKENETLELEPIVITQGALE